MLNWVAARIPTPFILDKVNCYLIKDEPVTLIDPGPWTSDALRAVNDFLASEGLLPENVARVITTHAHVDHHGMLGWFAERGAETYVHEKDLPKIKHYCHLQFWWDILEQAECPLEILDQLSPYLQREKQFSYPASDFVTVRDGDRLSFGSGELQVLHAPGHSAGQIVLWEEKTGSLFSGDFLLPNIYTGPVMEMSPDGKWNHPLQEMMAACSRLADLPVLVTMPGHGNPFAYYSRRLRELRQYHLDMAARVRVLCESGKSIFEVVRTIFPRASDWNLAVAVSQVWAYRDYWQRRI